MTGIAKLTVGDLRALAEELSDVTQIPAARAAQIRNTIHNIFDATAYTDQDKIADLDLGVLFDMLRTAKPHLARSTIDTYKGHVRRAVRMLVDRTAGRPDWWAAGNAPAAKRGKAKTKPPRRPSQAQKITSAPPAPASPFTHAAAAAAPPQAVAPPMISHRFPVRPGITATLELPADLSRTEADRLAQFVAALVL